MRWFFLLIILAICSPLMAATKYVWCGAGGGATGADFTNAYLSLPASLVRGNTYVVAGTVSCHYSDHTFDDAESGTTPITVRKAVSATDSGVAGWQASFATAVAKWTDTIDPDPENATGHLPFWSICRSYYTFDGITGSTDPITGPGGQGFLLTSANHFGHNMLYVSTNGCGAAGSVTLTNITIKNTEIYGIYDYSPVAVSSCTTDGSTYTDIVTASTPWPQGWYTGDTVAGFNSGLGVIFSATAISSVPSLLTEFRIATPNKCTGLTSVDLETPGSGGPYMIYPSDNFANLDFEYNYLHMLRADLFDLYNFNMGGANNLITHNWFERNSGSPTQHGQSIAGYFQNVLKIAFNVFKDVAGTAIYTNIGGGTQSASISFYGNLIWETGASAWTGLSSLIESISTGGINGLNVYNNTIVNQIGGNYDTNAGVIDSGNASPAGTWTVENSLYFGSSPATMTSAAIGTHDYNSLINTALGGTTPNSHEYHSVSGDLSPFVGIPAQNFNTSADALPSGCTGGTNCTNVGATLSSPYATDFNGNARTNGDWTRGAYQFLAGSTPILGLSASSFTWTSQSVGTTQTVKIYNTGGADATSFTLTVPAGFAQISTTCTSTLTAGSNCNVVIDTAQRGSASGTFSAAATGATTATASLTATNTNAPIGGGTVALGGTVTAQ